MAYQENVVIIEKDIEELNSLYKFHQYIKLCTFYHLNRCENGKKCSNCEFILNIRYIYVENLINGAGVDNLQNYCRKNFGHFFLLQTLLRSLAEVERERVRLKKRFCEILKVWNTSEGKK